MSGGAGAEAGEAVAAVDWERIGFIAAKAFGFWLGCTVLGILVAPRLTRGLKRRDGVPHGRRRCIH